MPALKALAVAGVVLDAFLLGATGFAAFQYSTNAEAFLQAVRQARPSLERGFEGPGCGLAANGRCPGPAEEPCRAVGVTRC